MSEMQSLVAQTLLFGFEGAAFNEARDQLIPLIELGAGGFILFSDNFSQRQLKKNIVDFDQTKTLIDDIQRANQLVRPLPTLIAVDYEGGQVDRLKHLAGAPNTVTAEHSAQLTAAEFSAHALAMATFVDKLGFNINFAPVVDVCSEGSTGIISEMQRSFGKQVGLVEALAWAFMHPFLQRGIACCLKHYPGHGSAEGDTHHQLIDITKTHNQIEQDPFLSILQHQNPLITVMTAHLVNRQLDESGLPATLSKHILAHHLRAQCEYQGVIISDDLQMLALADNYSLRQRLTMAFNAGCDLMIVANQISYDEPMEVIDTMVSLVNNGDISLARLKQAASRVKRLKQHIKKKRLYEAVS